MNEATYKQSSHSYNIKEWQHYSHGWQSWYMSENHNANGYITHNGRCHIIYCYVGRVLFMINPDHVVHLWNVTMCSIIVCFVSNVCELISQSICPTMPVFSKFYPAFFSQTHEQLYWKIKYFACTCIVYVNCNTVWTTH